MPKEVELLAYNEALGFLLAVLSIFGVLVVLAVTIVYVIHRHNPLVNTNDWELSFLIQLSLVITLPSSVLFSGKLNNWSCMARHVTLAVSGLFSLSVLHSWKDDFTVFNLQNFYIQSPTPIHPLPSSKNHCANLCST